MRTVDHKGQRQAQEERRKGKSRPRWACYYQRAIQEGDGSWFQVPWKNIVFRSDLWHGSFKTEDGDGGRCLITLYLKRVNR